MGSNVVEDLGKAFLPKKYRPKIRKYLATAGIYKRPYALVFFLTVLSLLITLFIELVFVFPFIQSFHTDLSSVTANLSVLFFIFISFAGVMLALTTFLFLTAHFFVELVIYKRIQEIETHLPDYLTVVSSNLKGGMNIDHAMWEAVKPKFGVLSEEIALISKKVMTGTDINIGLAELHEKYDSPELKRTLSLIISELEVGGKISRIIDDIVEQLKNTRKLKSKMVASVLSYVIFISAITMFITPLLFALSYNLIAFIHQFVLKISSSITSTSSIPSLLSNLDPEAIRPENFKYFGFVAVGSISLFSAMIISIIQKGDIKGGVKYVPVFLLISLLIYYFGLHLLGLVLGGIAV